MKGAEPGRAPAFPIPGTGNIRSDPRAEPVRSMWRCRGPLPIAAFRRGSTSRHRNNPETLRKSPRATAVNESAESIWADHESPACRSNRATLLRPMLRRSDQEPCIAGPGRDADRRRSIEPVGLGANARFSLAQSSHVRDTLMPQITCLCLILWLALCGIDASAQETADSIYTGALGAAP